MRKRLAALALWIALAVGCAPSRPLVPPRLALSAEAVAATGDRERAGRLVAQALERDPSPPPFARSLEELRSALAAGRTPSRRPAYPVSVTD